MLCTLISMACILTFIQSHSFGTLESTTEIKFERNEKIIVIESKKPQIVLGESNNEKKLKEERKKKEIEKLEYDRYVYSRGSTDVRIIGESNEQCVVYVQRITGSRKVNGWAGNVQVEGNEPKIGSVVKTWEGGGHVAIVVDIINNQIKVNDANYSQGFITERTIPINSEIIAGYIY